MDVTCTIEPGGDLLLTVDDETRKDIAECLADGRGYWLILCELFESYSCNGSYKPFDAGDANPFVGLTSAPCIAESMDVDDDGNATIRGRLWIYNDYQIKDPLDELAANGRTTFKRTDS